MNVNIKKAFIVDATTLDVEYGEHIQEGSASVKKSCESCIHDDLASAFEKLNIHLSTLSYQHDSKGKVLKEGVTCIGFELTGSGDRASVKLVGYRTLPNQKELKLSTPKQLFEGDFWNYPQMGELEQIIEECKQEVLAYLFEGKHAPDNQMELELEPSLN